MKKIILVIVIIGLTTGLVVFLINKSNNDIMETTDDKSTNDSKEQSPDTSDESTDDSTGQSISLGAKATELYNLLVNNFAAGTLTKAAVCRNTWSITWDNYSGSENFLIVDGVAYSITNPGQDYDHLVYVRSLLKNYMDCLQKSLDDVKAGGTGESIFLSEEEIRLINEKFY